MKKIKQNQTKRYNIDTETEQTEENENDENEGEPTTINGELMAGGVENVDDIKKNLSTLSLNDKVKYIIDLLETSNSKKTTTTTDETNEKNEKIYDLLYEMKETINKDFKDINNDIKAMKQNIIDIKKNII